MPQIDVNYMIMQGNKTMMERVIINGMMESCMIKRMVNACPRLEVIKRSVCIEGAYRAFARAKVHWGKLDAEKLVKYGPLEGKAHRHPEMYYDGVMKGAHLVADECTKDIILE